MESESETLPWRDGRRISPPPDATHEAKPSLHGFRLAGRIGRIEPDCSNPGWHLELSGAEEARCFAHGFVLAHASDATQHVFCPVPGTLVGESDTPVDVALESSRGSIRSEGPDSFLKSDNLSVVLRVERHDARTRWALVCGTGSEHETLVQARDAITISAKKLWSELMAGPRAEIAARATCSVAFRPSVTEAVELLLGSIRPAAGALTGRWINTRCGEAGMDFSIAIAILPAIGKLSPGLAVEILETMLQLQEPGQALPNFVTADDASQTAHAPLPLFAQAALALWRANPELDLPPQLLPKLVTIVTAQLDYFGWGPQKICRWRSAVESITPELHDADLASPDLTALLLAELDAIRELASPFPALAPLVGPLLARRDALEDALQNFFWNEERNAFQTRYLDGRPISRATVASALPLLGGSLRKAQLAAAVALLDTGGALRTTNGIVSWARWDGDDAPAPVVPLVQTLALRALRRAGQQRNADELAREIQRAVIAAHETRGALPVWISGDAPAGQPPLETAALVIHLAYGDELSSRTVKQTINPVASWLDQQRTGLAIAAILLALGLALFLAWPAIFPRPDDSVLATRLGIAQLRHAEGKFAEAAALYEGLIESPVRDSAQVDFRLGNAWARQGGWTQAEAAYRAGLERKPDQPRAWMNLALAQFQQRKFDDAERTYRDFLAKYSTLYPDLAARAQTALDLIAEQKR